jgi:hypothetical protein
MTYECNYGAFNHNKYPSKTGKAGSMGKRKRGIGEGTIYRCDDGSWRVQKLWAVMNMEDRTKAFSGSTCAAVSGKMKTYLHDQ